jgi:hypothetical protein
VGTSAARSLVASALAGGRMTLSEVTRLLDERGHALGFSRQLLTATFENIDAGISVVDAELNLSRGIRATRRFSTTRRGCSMSACRWPS